MLFTAVHRFVDKSEEEIFQKPLLNLGKQIVFIVISKSFFYSPLGNSVKAFLLSAFSSLTVKSFTIYPHESTNSLLKFCPETKKIFSFIGTTFDDEKISGVVRVFKK